ncbi:aromatic ring-hydroxylating dioxygenase subunit alpha [Immundisolibacter sp.]|uniref:aromatic ring-hydroxylating oxygenase subunit alpha n=1 Tax=Immundisolibacter sp. TaxID=1934948 RepID=UPI00262D742A|nr:aromatic ring-hydroxylating dioxygenase subunit alpha [Immundisolibacter sp.]MDD3651739.1 aromatic ring-hydroxylating dioxygenase subunit alpha [Immundisolibacter sp.]
MGKLEPPFVTKYPTDVPVMGDAPLPVAPYVSREFFEREREKVFKRAWLEVARAEDIPHPGDYLVVDIEVLGWSLILTRGADGQLRAFHNMCTHRGNKLAQRKSGNAKGFTCGFHGWVFGNDGELKHMAGEEYFPPGTDRCKLGLKPVTLDTWNGFVFIHPQAEPPQPLREFLGGMADQLDRFPFDRCTRIARYEATPRANWKVVLDAFQEAFHAIMVHRASLPNSAAAPQNPSAALTSARFYGPHRSLSAWANPAYRPPEVGMIVGKYGPTFATAKDQFPGINPSGDDNWWFDINVFFPNFFCDTGPGWYFTYNFWPISENQTRWTMDIYQLKAEHAGGLLAQEHTKILLRDAVLEDFSTLEATQQMMESGVLTHITISELEIALRHQMHVIDQWLAA